MPSRSAAVLAAAALDHDAIERAILARVISLHPVQLTLDELIREMTDQPGDFGSRDAITVVVRQLVGAGLLHRHGEFVLPTRAAVRALELGA